MRLEQLNTQNSTKREVITAAILAIIFGGYILYEIIFGGPVINFLSDHEKVVNFVKSADLLAPLSFLFIENAQVVLAPVPGQIIDAVGGYLFGWWGIPLAILGDFIGYFIILHISKKFGRIFVEKFISEKTLKKFDFLNSKKSDFALFMIFLLPGLPDDIVGFIAGLSEIKITRLLFIVFVGHLPSKIISVYLGMGVGQENFLLVLIISLVFVAAFILAALNREKILNFLSKISGRD